MSCIEQLSVQGIRSFGPEDRHRQEIEFFKPLTLILGPNGSGKTTIIECLRYMTTGVLPPNSEQGSCSFVHDPKIAGELEVKGQVELHFKDMTDKKMIANRNLVATQKQKKISLKTLDGVITRFNDKGEKSTFTSRCSEIGKEMVTALGVSKPILENVIFCHQEDSNWPLSKGKALRQKFDDIFATTRYMKALEEIKKIRASKMAEIKVMKSQVEGLKDNRRKAEEFANKLEETKSRLAESKTLILNNDNELKLVNDRLQEISDKEHKIARTQADLEYDNKLVEKLKKDELDLRNSIKNLFNGTKEELETEMNFGAIITLKEKQLEQVKCQCLKVENEQKDLQKEKCKLQEEVGKLKARHKIHCENIVKRNAKLQDLSEQLGLGKLSSKFGDENIEDSQIENVMKNWNQRLAATQQELKDIKVEYENEGNVLQTKIDKNKDEKAQKVQKQKIFSEKVEKNEEVLRHINTELSQVDTLTKRQDDLKENLKRAEEALKMAEKKVDEKALHIEISGQQLCKKELDLKLKGLNQEMTQVQKESKTRTEIELINKEKTAKQEAVDKMLNQHKDTVIRLFRIMPEGNVQDSIKSFVTTMNHEIQEKNKEIRSCQSKLAAFEATKKHNEQQLKKNEELLKSYRSKIFEVCGDKNFDKRFDDLEKTVKKLQDVTSSLNGSLHLFNKYIEELSAQKPCCPLCQRSFAEEEQARQLKDNLRNHLERVPSELKDNEKQLAEKQKQLSNMLELKPLKHQVQQISETDIPNLNEKICKLDENIEKFTNNISDLENILDSKQCDAETATDILPDLAMLDQNQRELLCLEERLSALTHTLGSSDVSRTIQIVGAEQSSVHKDIESCQNSIELAKTKIIEHKEQVQKLLGERNDLRAEKVEIAGRLQEKNALEEQLMTLSNENQEHTDLIKEMNSELIVLEKNINELTWEKTNFLRKKEEEIEKIRKKIIADEKEKDYIDTLMKEIERYISAEQEKKLHDQESAIAVIDSNIQDKTNELSLRNTDKDALHESIVSQQMKLRECKDNLNLMQINEEIKSLQSKCSQLQKIIGDIDISEKEELTDQKEELIKECSSEEGRQTELVQQISHFEEQLCDGAYKDAKKKYIEGMIDLRTTELVCDDLNKCYIAFDYAVVKYHHMKMEEINKIIRRLWQQTYALRGVDIDYIEIRSTEDTETGLEKGKRVYNYEVIWMKDEKVLDMRSHCSAGQKVLASLIIRLALAETFCLNCGILALDEPTTNLDRDNIINLAQALVELVKSRSEQRNFQLIIITHDEHFIASLGHSDLVDFFYKVKKDSNAFSRITKCRISDIDPVY